MYRTNNNVIKYLITSMRNFKLLSLLLSLLSFIVGRKRLGNIFCASWVVAYFVSNFLAMATRVGRPKIWPTLFANLTQKTLFDAKMSEISIQDEL